ncbi:MAG: hypothetical protein JSU05_15360, partial [Bacteroidetes bacterium]|nr:hypothetical protein [Bacteroidota bacterium]
VAPDLSTETLIQQIERLFQTMLHPSGLETLLQHDSFTEDLLNDDMKLAVYRIIQEQFTNIIKYAEASLVVISLSTTGKIFSMRIADDGKGMEPVNSYEGIGLRNIYSRLSVLGGEMKIDTEPDKGFAIEIEVPI